MVEALKKMDKKFLIIAGCLLILPILVVIFLAIIQGCNPKGVGYEEYEKNMISAAKKYISKEGISLEEEGAATTITLQNLVDKKLIRSPEQAFKGGNCTGSVTVRRNGASIEINEGGFLNYIVNLSCDDYSTETLVKKIMTNLVTEGSGLYQIGDEYIFRGSSPNNYVTFYGDNYRILGVDSYGMVRLMRIEAQNTYRPWDNKYNIDVKASYGKNIFDESYIQQHLIARYSNSKVFNNKAKEHIVAYDVCVGRRSNSDYSISRSLDCNEKLGKQLISIINVSDFALASIDPNCNSIVSKSCKNYNYLKDILSVSWTINSVAENTYQVFGLSDGLAIIKDASAYGSYSYVIYIDGNEKAVEGKGTRLHPYVYK